MTLWGGFFLALVLLFMGSSVAQNDTLQHTDTLLSTSTRIASIDSISPAPFTDTSKVPDTTELKTPLNTADTVSAIDTVSIVNKPAFIIGIGWQIGPFTPLEIWKNAIPTSFKKAGFTTDSLISESYQAIVTPPHYAAFFPVSIGGSLFQKGAVAGTFAVRYAGLLRKSERIISGTTIDSTDLTLSVKRRLTYHEIHAGIYVLRTLGTDRFKITGSDETAISLGIFGIPFSRISLHETLNDTLKTTRTGIGIGVNWEIGLTTAKKKTGSSFLRSGVFYSGSFISSFTNYDTNKSFTRNDLEFIQSNKSSDLSLISHRLYIMTSLCKTKSKPQPPKNPEQ